MVDLVARSTRAFETVPYPAGTSLCAVYDDEGNNEFFSNRTWQSIGPLELASHTSALSFFTAQAYHSFLPSFMIAGVKFPRDCGELARAVAFSLTPPKMNPNRPSFISRWQLFAT